jgi:hypothetical protein
VEFLKASVPLPGGDRMHVWATVPDYPAWVVELEVYLTAAIVVGGELRVFPRTTVDPGFRSESPLWTKEPRWTEDSEDVPMGGVPSRLLRQINIGEMLQFARESATEDGSAIALNTALPTDFVADTTRTLARFTGPAKRPGSHGHGIAFYLDWAIGYVERVNAGARHPVAALAKDVNRSPTYVRDVITDARRRYGLISSAPGQGRAGGTLTPKALKLIKERQRRQEEE